MSTNRQRWLLNQFDLQTAKLHIREFTEADVTTDYLGWLNNKHHMRYSNQRFFRHSRDSAISYRKNFDSESSAFLALELRDSDTLVGTATVVASVHHGTADIGILIGPEYVGMHIAHDAVGAIAAQLLADGFRKVTIGTSAANTAMLRVIAGLGFIPDGTKRRQELIDGIETDVDYFALFAET
jgi:ribosomal-protein-alanine N-acetyltransferase